MDNHGWTSKMDCCYAVNNNNTKKESCVFSRLKHCCQVNVQTYSKSLNLKTLL